MLEIAESQAHPGVRTIVLAQDDRPVVVLDAELLRALDRSIDALPAGTRGLVIASAGERAFVAGADIRALIELDDDPLDRYLAEGQRVFGRLLGLPFPTAAAVDGAALGGGLELALHCDLVVGCRARADGKPFPVGLPETTLGICPGWGGSNTLAGRLDPTLAIDRACRGEPFPSPEAADAGLFDELAETADGVRTLAEDAVAAAVTPARIDRRGAPRFWAGRPRSGTAAEVLAALDAATRGAEHDDPDTPADSVRRCLDAGLASGWPAALDAERHEIRRLRARPETRAALRSFFEKR